MANLQHSRIASRLFVTFSRKRLATLSVILYLMALFSQVFVLSYSGRTYLLEGTSSIPIIATIHSNMDQYTCCILFSVLVLNIYLYGLSAPQLLFGIAATCLIAFNGNEDNLKSVVWTCWLIIAYPPCLKFNTSISYILYINIFFLVLTLLLSFSSILPDHTQYLHDTFRHSFGFVVPNTLGMHATFILLLWSMKKANVWSIRHILIEAGILLIMYSVCDSRGALIVCAIQIIILSIRACIKNYNTLYNAYSSLIYNLSCVIIPLVAIASVGGIVMLSYIEGTELFTTISKLLTSRPSFAVRYFTEYGFHLLGQNVQFTGEKAVATSGGSWSGVDGAFIQSSLIYGLLITFGYVVLATICAIQNAKKRGGFGFATYIIAFSIYCVTENIVWDVTSNIMLLAIGCMLSNALWHQKKGSNLNNRMME